MQADNVPLVSICVPTHNDATVVSDALSSALQQSYASIEILVLDNHSSDETWQIVTGIAAGDARIRCVRHAENIGMARNFSACIAAARGELVLILCADDVLESRCVSLLAAALRDHPDAVFAACGRIWTDHSLQRIRLMRARVCDEKVDADSLLRECFVHGNRIGEPSAVMFRRMPAYRGFNADYSQALDLEMWFHLLEQGSAVLLSKPLCSIRQHPEQTTQANIASGRIVEDKRLLYRQYAGKVASKLALWEKLLWDARMASSAARTRIAGGGVNASEIEEVFCKLSFVYLFLPLAQVFWKFRSNRNVRRLLRSS